MLAPESCESKDEDETVTDAHQDSCCFLKSGPEAVVSSSESSSVQTCPQQTMDSSTSSDERPAGRQDSCMDQAAGRLDSHMDQAGPTHADSDLLRTCCDKTDVGASLKDNSLKTSSQMCCILQPKQDNSSDLKVKKLLRHKR